MEASFRQWIFKDTCQSAPTILTNRAPCFLKISEWKKTRSMLFKKKRQPGLFSYWINNDPIFKKQGAQFLRIADIFWGWILVWLKSATLVNKMSTRIHQKCPWEFTYVVHEISPFMYTKSLPPIKTPQSNGLYLVMVVQLQLLSNHVLCMSKETLLTDGWPDRNSLAYFFFYYSFMMSWFLSQKWLEVTILRSRGFNAPLSTNTLLHMSFFILKYRVSHCKVYKVILLC